MTYDCMWKNSGFGTEHEKEKIIASLLSIMDNTSQLFKLE